jgi:hypothetical protein
MIQIHLTGDALWERMERAVEKVRERLERAATTLEQAGIPYAICGGNAVRTSDRMQELIDDPDG